MIRKDDENAAIRQELFTMCHGELRPDSFATIREGAYNGLYVAMGITNVHLHDVVVIGAVNIWGQNITGRIYVLKGTTVRKGGNLLLMIECTPAELLQKIKNAS